MRLTVTPDGYAVTEDVVQLRRRANGPCRSTATGHRVTRDGQGGRPWQTRARPWTAPCELLGRWLARRSADRVAAALALHDLRSRGLTESRERVASPEEMWPYQLPPSWPE